MFGKKEPDIPEEIREKLLSRIKPILARELGVGEYRITPEARLKEDLGIDSLGAVELIMALEDEFAIEIMDDDAEKMEIIKDIVVYLAQKVKL